MLPKCVLRVPPSGRGGRQHRKRTASFTLGRLERWERGDRMQLWDDIPPARRRAGRRQLDLEAAAAAPVVTPAQVMEHLRAFARGTATPASGLRVQHLLDACACGEEDALAAPLARVVNWLAAGDAPGPAARHLAGARLIALLKPNGRLRPIAIGEVLRRLVAKCLCSTVQGEARALLWPLQTGVAVPKGAECSIHTLRQWCARHRGSPDRVLLKLDFSNAFNQVNRAAVLRAVRDRLPQLLPWVHWCYSAPSNLRLGAFAPLASAEGVQQGDPLGPLLFALVVQPLAERLAGVGDLDLAQFYLDDGVLCGPALAVARALRLVQDEGPALGLHLNLAKCELVVPSGQLSPACADLFPDPLRVDPAGANRVRFDGNFAFLDAREDCSYLGSPIGSLDHCNQVLTDRVDRVRAILRAVATVRDPEVAFKIMKHCVNYGRVMHLMRTVPYDSRASGFTAFDNAVCDAFSDVTGVFPSPEQWARACRGVWAGGCGLRSAHRHWPAAFLTSFLDTRAACCELDAAYDATGDGLAQRDLSRRVDAADRDADVAPCTVADRAQLRSELLPGAGDFLEVMPSRSLGLAMRRDEFLVELKKRLLYDLFPAGLACPLCSGAMDRRGHHCMLCPCGGDRTTMHNVLRGTFANDLSGAGLHPEVETPHLLLPDPEHAGQSDRRPADVFLHAFVRRLPTAFDFAVTSPHRLDVQRRAADVGGIAAADYEGFKRTFRDTADECARDGISFIPIGFEPSGGCGPSATDVSRRLTRGGSAGAGTDPAAFALRHRQKWSVLVRRLAARRVLRRLQGSSPLHGGHLLSPAQEAAEATAAAREAEVLAAQRVQAAVPVPARGDQVPPPCSDGAGHAPAPACGHFAHSDAGRGSVPRVPVAAAASMSAAIPFAA
eukprot:gene17976-biopygen815